MTIPLAGLRHAGDEAAAASLAWVRRDAAGPVALAFALSALAVIAGSLFAVAAPYSLDEAIYILMAEAAREGRLSIPNGYELYPSNSLTILFLREGPLGLVPQYPSGYGFLALPFYLTGGARGLIFMNALAHLAAMAATYGLTRQMEASRQTALAAALMFGFGSFAVAYAVGIWPHAVSVAVACGSVLAIVAAVRTESVRKGLGLALLGGLVAGLGTTIRVDVILLAPPVLLWLVAQRQHWAKAALFAAGIAPGLVLAAWLNALKFGAWLPVSYGSGGGNTSLAVYWPLLPAMALAAAAALALSSGRVRAACSRRNLLLAGAAALVPLLALEETRELLFRVATGFHILVVDFQRFQPGGEQAMFSRTGEGHLLLVGTLKRALLQSLPVLGILPLLVLTLHEARRPVRALFGLLALVATFWMLPFALRHWHGGSPQNMRYFLPILPILSVLTAIALARLVREAGLAGRSMRMVLLASAASAWIAVVVVFIGVAKREDWALAIATDGSLALAAAVAAAMTVVVAAQGGFRRAAARAGLGLATAALVWGGVSSFAHDLMTSQVIRKIMEEDNERAARLEEGALVITGSAYRFMPQLLRPDSFVAVPGERIENDERRLIGYHLAQGRKAYVDGWVAETVLPALGAPAFETRMVPFGREGLVELRAPAALHGGEDPRR